MMRTSNDSALLIALLFKRSGKTRARLSTATVKRLSKRKHLRVAFIEKLVQDLDDLGIIFLEVERGGYGVISSSALNGAPAITAKKYLKEDLTKLNRGEIDFDDIFFELDPEQDVDEDDDY